MAAALGLAAIGAEAGESRAMRLARLDKNKADFRRMKRVDPEGWEKVTAMGKPADSLGQVEKERLQRKTEALVAFCVEGRFLGLSEVDALAEMKAPEKAFCKDRLKLVNPLMP